jgi:predicted Zn-ribbon and HTH transcriptional regulator
MSSASECPKCESPQVYLSDAGGAERLVKRLAFLHPVRCEACGFKYWGFGLKSPGVRPKKPSSWTMKRLDMPGGKPGSSFGTRPVPKPTNKSDPEQNPVPPA